MDLETAMVLVSNILICIFVALQINHVKRYPKLASSISLLMLVILSVGQGMRLILSMEGEVVRLSSLMVLLVQLRLVQLVWEREANGNRERKPGCALLSLYVIGGLLAFVMNGRGSSSKYFSKHSVWRGLKSYGGVIVDGFLVPQVVLNAWRGGADKALIWPFYVGMSAAKGWHLIYTATPHKIIEPLHKQKQLIMQIHTLELDSTQELRISSFLSGSLPCFSFFFCSSVVAPPLHFQLTVSVKC